MASPSPADRPLVTLLLLAYRQQETIAAALESALAQTYSPLEIVVSDDASTDGTWLAIERVLSAYPGPHCIVINRNASNLGIGAHINRMVGLSHGELLFIAAGDDVSVPGRCERVVDAWIASGRRLDLIASHVVDLDEEDRIGAVIEPSDLGAYRNAADWLARPPHVIGAAQAWTRRVFDRFGPLPAGTVAEDLLMVFRAIVSGGAITLAEPLVRYRRGGISRRRRSLHASDVTRRLIENSRHALVEIPQLLGDARRAGQASVVEEALTTQLERERFIHDIFAARRLADRWRTFTHAPSVPLALRCRVGVYAAFPFALAPFFALKRLFASGL